MGYGEYDDICRSNSVMSRGVIMIITISESLPSASRI